MRKIVTTTRWVVLLPVAFGAGSLAEMIVGTAALYFWPLVEGTDSSLIDGPPIPTHGLWEGRMLLRPLMSLHGSHRAVRT